MHAHTTSSPQHWGKKRQRWTQAHILHPHTCSMTQILSSCSHTVSQPEHLKTTSRKDFQEQHPLCRLILSTSPFTSQISLLWARVCVCVFAIICTDKEKQTKKTLKTKNNCTPWSLSANPLVLEAKIKPSSIDFYKMRPETTLTCYVLYYSSGTEEDTTQTGIPTHIKSSSLMTANSIQYCVKLISLS